MADGTQWLGRAVRPGIVVYIGREDGRKTTKAHFRKMGIRNLDRIFAMSIGEKVPIDGRVVLFENTIRTHKPALVILDTVARYVKVKDGNDYHETADAMAPYVEAARELGAHFLVTTHNRKGGAMTDDGVELMGSSGWQAHADTIMSIGKDEGDRVVYAFGRDDAGMEKTIVTMGDDGHVQAAGTKRAANDADVMHAALRFIRDSLHPVSAPDVRIGIKRGKPLVTKALRYLVSDGDIELIGTGPATRYRVKQSPGIRTGTVPPTGGVRSPVPIDPYRDRDRVPIVPIVPIDMEAT